MWVSIRVSIRSSIRLTADIVVVGPLKEPKHADNSDPETNTQDFGSFVSAPGKLIDNDLAAGDVNERSPGYAEKNDIDNSAGLFQKHADHDTSGCSERKNGENQSDHFERVSRASERPT